MIRDAELDRIQFGKIVSHNLLNLSSLFNFESQHLDETNAVSFVRIIG